MTKIAGLNVRLEFPMTDAERQRCAEQLEHLAATVRIGQNPTYADILDYWPQREPAR